MVKLASGGQGGRFLKKLPPLDPPAKTGGQGGRFLKKLPPLDPPAKTFD
jgi:hypothetical protein